MPVRKEPLISGHVYHVFNKSIDSRKIFSSDKNCRLMLELMEYYRSGKALPSFSRIRDIKDPIRKKQIVQQTSIIRYFRVDIIAYCLMPNHFHLLLRQKMTKPLTNPKSVLSEFSNNRDEYRKFVFERADYQRSIEQLKH